MANYCLVEKLKGVVDNDSLSILGIGKLVFNASESNSNLAFIQIKDGVDVYFDKDVKITDGTVISAGTRIPNNPGNTTIKSIETGTYTMTFTKYTISYLWCSVGTVNTDLDSISYSKLGTLYLKPIDSLDNFHLLDTVTGLSELHIANMKYAGNISNDIKSLNLLRIFEANVASKNTSLTGNISVLQDKQYLTGISLKNQAGITGNIGVLKGILPNIRNIDLLNTGISGDFKYLALLPSTIQDGNFQTAIQGNEITGSIEDFVAVKRGRGETTGSMSFAWLGDSGKISFQGVYFSNKASYSLSWTASTITFDGVEIQNSDVDTLS